MDIDNTCGMLIRQIHNSLEKMSNKDLKEKGLTLVQVSALFSINDTAENVRITELGEQCCKEAEDSMLKTETFLLSNLTEIEKVLFKDLLEKVNNTLK